MDVNNSLRDRSVLVTGAGGFIGSRIVERLRKSSVKVVGLHNDLKSVDVAVDSVFGDVADYDRMCDVISSNEIDTIFHLAGNAIVRISARDPMTTYRTNVMGTVALLEAARNVGRLKSIVVASSDKAYGDHEALPYTEEHPLVPKNTYDTSKACMDLVARSYAKNYSMPVCVTRCSNVYGPGDKNFSRIVPNTIRRVLAGESPQLYSDIASMEREFVYIDDVVDAYVLLAAAPTSRSMGEAYNVGGTGPVKISDLAEMISMEIRGEVMPSEIIEREPAFKEIQKQYIDASKLLNLTGWKPKTVLKEGIKKTVPWYRGSFLSEAVRETLMKYGFGRK